MDSSIDPVPVDVLFREESRAYSILANAAASEGRRSGKFREEFNGCFKKWQVLFQGLYDISNLTRVLFEKHALLVGASICIIKDRFKIDLLEIVDRQLIVFLECFTWLEKLGRFMENLRNSVSSIQVKDGDNFNMVYPLLIPHLTKHSSGEYYTPPNLSKLMVGRVYKPGLRALDPSCGSGTFLCDMVRSILDSPLSFDEKGRAINKLAGFDKNYLAIFMAFVNVVIMTHTSGFGSFYPAFYCIDALFYDDKFLSNVGQFDVIVGNPPWIVLGGIENSSYKEELKELSKQLGIYIGGKNASNLEVAILFLFKMREFLVPKRGVIFFILPYSIITGSQHARARIFRGFSGMEVWKFTSQPFRIHSICLLARMAPDIHGPPRSFVVPFTSVKYSKGREEFVLFEDRTVDHEPYSIERGPEYGKIKSVQRYIPSEKKKNLLPLGDSPYKSLFYKGAQVFPRKMFFIDVVGVHAEKGGTILKIIPSKDVKAKKLARWDFNPYTESQIEAEYVFKVAKSTFLLPYFSMKILDAFLPFEKVELQDTRAKKLVPVADLKKFARNHFHLLNAVYNKNKKPGASHGTLLEIINYQNCMENQRQMFPLKVVYNGGGSIVKGAIVEGEIIVDYSMFYYPPNSLDEAYYLLGYLNSPVLTESVKLVGSTGYHGSLRNVVKHPWDFPLPLFDKEEPNHLKLSKVAREIEVMIKNKVNDLGKENGGKKTRIGYQNLVLSDESIKGKMEDSSSIVTRILNSCGNLKSMD
ncbi:MAG: N-6 DNA methylase [Promethearchaeota archaeon]